MQQINEKEELLDPRAFAYWLQGFFEISDAKELNEKQVAVIKEHLELIFRKVTPSHSITITESTDPFKDIVKVPYVHQHGLLCSCDKCREEYSIVGPIKTVIC